MTLPLSRDFDAVDSGPLPHTTVNGVQDAIIGKRHGSLKMFLAAIDGFTDGTPVGASGYVELAANHEVRVNLPLPFGTELTAFDVYVEMSNLADTFDSGLEAGTDGFKGTTGLVTVGTGAIEKLSMPTALPYTMIESSAPPAIRNYRFAAATPGNAGTVRIYGWDITYQKTT